MVRVRRLLIPAAALVALVAAGVALADPSPPTITAPTGLWSDRQLTWVDAGDETDYDVAISPWDGATCTGYVAASGGTDLPADTTSFAFSAGDAADGSAYCFRVTADHGSAPASSAVTGVTVDVSAPAGTLDDPGANVRGTVALASSDLTDATSGVDTVDFERSPAGGGAWVNVGTDSSAAGGWTVNWVTGGVSDGLYDLRAVATDAAGNVHTTATVANVRVDNTAPSGTLDDPGSPVLGTIALTSSGVADGGSGLASVAFQRSPAGASTWTAIGTDSSSTGGWTVNWATGGVTDGLYDLRAIVTDVAGNPHTSATVANVRVDNTFPTVTLDAPAASAQLRGDSVAMTATPADSGSGVVSVAFQRSAAGANTWSTTIGTDGSSTGGWGITWDTTTATPDGLYDLRAVATDAAGNVTNSATIANVRVDNTSPTVTMDAPVASAHVSGSNVAMTATPADGGSGVATVAFQRSAPGANTWSTTIGTDSSSTGGWAIVWDTTTATPDGLYDLRAVATDAAGNVTSSATIANVLVDNNVPTAPGAPSATTPRATAPVLVWPASSSLDVASYDVYRDGGGSPINGSPVTGTTYTDATLPLDGSADGSHTYTVKAYDAAANPSALSATGTVVLDTTAPVAPAGFAATAAADGTITVSVPATADKPAPNANAGTGIASTIVRRSAAGGAAPANKDAGTAVCSGTAAAATCTDGTAVHGLAYAYSLFAVDAAGNVSPAASATATANDATAPGPANGLTATAGNASATLSWQAADLAASPDLAGYSVVRKAGATPPANAADGVEACRNVGAASTTCAVTGLTNDAPVSFAVFAFDEAPNYSTPIVATVTPHATIVPDTKAPAKVRSLTASAKGGKVKLAWKKPADNDVVRYAVVRNKKRAPKSLRDGDAIYSGKAPKATISQKVGTTVWYGVFALDAAANVSKGASVEVEQPWPGPLYPGSGAALDGAVKLRWDSVKGAAYYNIQIFDGKKRVAISWPTKTSYSVPGSALKKGHRYTWYVWPGFGALAKAQYGGLIGKATFKYGA